MNLFILFGIIVLTMSGCTLSNNSGTEASKNTIEAITGTLYLDVREETEWAAGHVKGALHMKLSDIEAGKLPSIHKDTPIAVYCRSGRRSGIATEILQKNGFSRAYNAGGMTELKNIIITQ